MMVLLVEKRNVLKMRIHYDTVCNALYFIKCYINKSRGIRTKSNPMGIKTIDKTKMLYKNSSRSRTRTKLHREECLILIKLMICKI